MAKKRNQKAFKIIRKAANSNGVQLSQNILDNFKEDEEDEESKLNIKEVKETKYVELLRSRVMAVRCLILFFIW